MTSELFAGQSLPNGSHLAAHLRQLADARARFFAVRLEVLRGRRMVSQPWPSAVIWQPLEILTENANATVYSLGDADLVLLCDNLSIDYVDEAINRILRLFRDPSLFGSASASSAKVSWYDLMGDNDFEALMSAAEASRTTGRQRFAQGALRPITIADLPFILDRMDQLPIARMIRRQHVIQVHRSGKLLPLFQQLYVSIGEFQRAFAPGIDTAAQPDLFRHLSAGFDRTLLAYLVEEENKGLTREPFCVNIHISSTDLPVFTSFERCFSKRDNVMLEVHLENILDDIDSFHRFRERAREHGIGLVLGGVKSPSFLHLDLARLGVDLIKVLCPGASSFDSAADGPRALERSLDRIGHDCVILAGLETEDRLRWALGLGISHFQGRFVDKLMRTLRTKGSLSPEARQ